MLRRNTIATNVLARGGGGGPDRGQGDRGDHRDRRYPYVESVIMQRRKRAGGRVRRDSLFVENLYLAFGSPLPTGALQGTGSGGPSSLVMTF
jgi:hypothetical protein